MVDIQTPKTNNNHEKPNIYTKNLREFLEDAHIYEEGSKALRVDPLVSHALVTTSANIEPINVSFKIHA